jgi:hypothetical protein
MKLGGLTISDSILGPGSLYVTNITASNLQVVNITSSFVTSSTIYTSGSNIFGDEPSDTHTFIGGITASSTIQGGGNISIPLSSKLLLDGPLGNDYLTANASFFNVYRNGSQRISMGTNSTDFWNSGTSGVRIQNTPLTVTGVGYISSSGNIETDGYFSGSGEGLNNIPASGITGLNLSRIASGSVTASIAPNKGFEVNTNITASGNISASGFISASEAHFGGSSTTINNSIITTEITASGAISASDKVFGDRMIASAYVQTPSLESPNTIIEVAANLNVSGEITSSGNIKGNNLILSNGGGAATPAIRLSNDTNNGIYFPAPDNIIFVNAGASTLALNSSAINNYKPTIFSDTLTVGTSGTGHDVTFYGDTNGKFLQWDQSEDKLTVSGETAINGDTAVTGDSTFSGKFAITSSAGEVFEVMTTNAAASSAGIEIHSAATQTNRKVGLTFTASNDSGTTNEYTMGLARDVGSFIIVQNNLANLTTDNAIFEMGATGAITASGDISCSFQESTITATTGSFNHIITDGETLEFRDASTRAKVGALKFDSTNGLEVKDSAGNEGKLKTKEINIPLGGNMVVNAATINFNNLPTSDPGVSGQLWRDTRDNKIIVSQG